MKIIVDKIGIIGIKEGERKKEVGEIKIKIKKRKLRKLNFSHCLE